MKSFLTKRAPSCLAILIIFFGCIRTSESLNNNQVDAVTRVMLANHVSQNTFDDTISERILNNMIKLTDPFKMYYLQSDIDKLNKHKTKIDNYAREKNYSFLDEFFTIYLQRFSERMELFDKLIKKDFDFTIDESMASDPDSISFAKNNKEIEERWRKRIKFQLLNFVKTGMEIDKAKGKLVKRYKIVKEETKKYNDTKQKSTYLKAFSLALDPHTGYMTPQENEDFNISMNLKLTGIGAVLRSEDGFVFVDSIIPGGPASKLPSGRAVKPNDKIVAVAQGDKEPESVIDIPLRDAVDKIRGKKGTTVKLSILRKDTKTKKEKMTIISIVRDRVILEQQAAKYKIHTIKSGSETLKIGYIMLPSFYMDFEAFQKNDPTAKMASNDILNALGELNEKHVDAVVFDLRNNPGGALLEAKKIAGYFIKQGPILMVKAHNDVMTHNDTDPAMYFNGPLVVLVNSSSASASEIFAGAIRDYKRGLIIGPNRTFGKGSVQIKQDISREIGAVKITIQLFYQPNGTSNNKGGISPNIFIPSYSLLNEFHENELDYALDGVPIERSDYKDFGSTYISGAIIGDLAKKSTLRRSKDSDFIKLQKEITEWKDSDHEKSVSLLLDNDEIEESEEESHESLSDTDKVYDLERDIFLREAFNVTADYVTLLQSR